jgi:hypothetical protein
VLLCVSHIGHVLCLQFAEQSTMAAVSRLGRLYFLLLVWFCFCLVISTARLGRKRQNSQSLWTSSKHVKHKHKRQVDFPSLDDASEMSSLSLLIYSFRNEEDDDKVCEKVLPPLKCHW